MGNAPSIYEFRQGIVDLQSNHVRPDDEFWKQIFLANLNLKELHTLYQATDVRRLILEQPKNLNSLIRKAMDQIAAYIKYHKEITDTRSVHNAISILTRTIPVVLEAEHRSFANSFFLLNIYETQCEKELDSFSNGGDVAQMGAKRDLKGTIAHLYAELVLKLFFIPNFTLSGVDEAHASTALWYSSGDFARVSVVQDDETHVPNEGKSIPLMHTWERFTRVSNTRPNSHIQSNRSEVLTLLLVSLSGTLFQDDHEALTHTDILQDAFRSKDQLIRSLREQLILSLLGVIRATDCHTASSWNILSSGAKPILLEPSVHVLLALLRYDDDELEESECENEEKKSCQSSSVWRFLQEIPTFVLEDVVCHIGALLRFSYVEASSSGWSSRAPPSLTCYRELIVLVWKLFDGIRPILVPVCRSARFQDLFLSLIHIVLSVRRDAARYGDVQMCSLILVLLSGEREFSVALSTVPLPTSVRLDVSSNVTFENGSTLTDALCLAVYTLVTSSPSTPWLTGLVDAWITTLSNISPYIKRLTMVAAQKIIVLFEAFSQTRYFTKDANSFFRLCMLLETLANVVQYQYDGGISLVYALLSTPDGLSRVYNYVSLYCQESVETESKPARDTEDSANAIPPTGASECNDELKLLWNPHLQGALDTLRRLTHELTKDMSTRSLSTDTDVVQYLSSTTPVGIIPVPHPILIRRFRAQLHTYQWVTTWTWTLIYHKYLYYFDANTVRLLSLVVNEGQSGTSLALDQGKDVKSVPFKEKETPRY